MNRLYKRPRNVAIFLLTNTSDQMQYMYSVPCAMESTNSSQMPVAAAQPRLMTYAATACCLPDASTVYRDKAQNRGVTAA